MASENITAVTATSETNTKCLNTAYPDNILNGRKIYAFGDSIVYGHKTPSVSFTRLLAAECHMDLGSETNEYDRFENTKKCEYMYAVNGASVITLDSSKKEDINEQTKGNYILNQVLNASAIKPDVIIFNGGTNDAYDTDANDHVNLFEHLGVIKGPAENEFDSTTFCGGFESIIYSMRKKWGNTPIVYITTHKSGGRKWDAQCTVRNLALEICKKWDANVADVFRDAALDTRDEDQMKKYIINGAGSHPNEAACRKFYIPLIKSKLISLLSDGKSVITDNTGRPL